MCYIHLRGFMHRDLKPSNILLNNEYELRISDFGHTHDDKLDAYQSKGFGTLRFMAPELLAEDDDDDEDEGERKAKHTNKIMFIITGKCSKFNMLNIAKGSIPRLPSSVPNWVRELIKQYLSLKPENRSSITEIFETIKSNNYDLFSDSKAKKLTKMQLQMKKEIDQRVLKIEAFEFHHQNDQNH